MKKIRIAFIYKKSYVFLSGKHFDNTTYHFFMNALKRSNSLDVTYFPSDNIFDVKNLKGKFDIILLPDNHSVAVPELIGIKNNSIPIICRIGDPHNAKSMNKHNYHEEIGIDYYFNFTHKDYFYKYYPSNFRYKTIIFGLEPILYENLTPYKDRIKNRILNSGAIGNAKIFSRIINSIRNPDSNAYKHYKLRTMCNQLPYVDYTSTLEHEYVNDRYPLLLSKYAASIVATTYFPTIRYWEVPAAGCLTFMEITEKNNGRYLGYKDEETAIFINEKNYKSKFEEYLEDIDNPKWLEIANAGRQYALSELNNDKATDSLVELMQELI
ncbi:glycosyltransferase family 1 protein [Candidatus Nitrosarchaeum limnium]|nr:glycosyltransferase family 1 protein [Candidatus Nitrosarchaeum limnium]